MERDAAGEALFDRGELHAGAAGAFDREGADLLAARQVGTEKRSKPPFESRREPMDTITDDDLVGEPMLAWSDLSGRIVGRYFVRSGQLVALREEGHVRLRRLAEKVLRAKPFSRALSQSFVEEEIFRWWRATLRGESDAPLSAHLLDAAEKAVARHTLMVPLVNIEVEAPFRVHDVLVTPMHRLPFERFGDQALRDHPERAEDVRGVRSQLRRELAHLTGVQVEVVGDLEHAREKAREIAFDMADVLRLMSPAAATWNIAFPCWPSGYEHEPSTTVLEMRGEELGTISSGLFYGGTFRWRVTSAEIDELMKAGFQGCAAFFAGRELTDFERRVKTAVTAYSRGVASHDQRDRLVLAMSAAEHLLLRDANEPIQAGVGDRIAFLIADDAEGRQRVAADFRKAYGYRSRQVHHLASVDDEETLAAFHHDMWLMLLAAISNMHRYRDQADFLAAIDRRKYS